MENFIVRRSDTRHGTVSTAYSVLYVCRKLFSKKYFENWQWHFFKNRSFIKKELSQRYFKKMMFFLKDKGLKGIAIEGFTLIEALVLLFIFSVVSVTFLQTYAVGTHLIIESKNRLGATALANQKMEIIRSLNYDTVGLTTSSPGGDIPEFEDVSVNTTLYHIHTIIQYIDDPFDGTSVAGTDALPNDYKRVRLEVSWGLGGENQKVILFSNISPNGVETPVGGGLLIVNVLDAGGAGIPGVDVHIANTSTAYSITPPTDATGNITLPGTPSSVPAGTQDYTFSLSKAGYYTATTYPPSPPSTFDPIDEHLSVLEGVLNSITIVLTKSLDLTLQTQDPFGTAIPNIGFTITGGKVLSISPVMKYTLDQVSTSTDGSGTKTFAGESAGQYTLTTSDARYEFLKLNPEETVGNVIDATAGGTKNVDVILIDTQIGSIKAIVQDQTDGTPLVGASVHLTNVTLGYDATQTTDQYGFVYFPTSATGLVAGDYTMETTMTGFADVSDTVPVAGVLVTRTTLLTPN